MNEPGRQPDEAGEDKTRQGLVFTAVVLAAGLVFGWLAQFGVPGLGGFSVVWPQQWVFFADLDKNSVTAYRFVAPGDALQPLESVGSGGLGRAAESRLGEAWEIARAVPDDYWISCSRQNPVDCGFDLGPDDVHVRPNAFAGVQLCGKVVLSVERTDVPPFGQLPSSPTRAHRIALLDLECA